MPVSPDPFLPSRNFKEWLCEIIKMPCRDASMASQKCKKSIALHPYVSAMHKVWSIYIYPLVQVPNWGLVKCKRWYKRWYCSHRFQCICVMAPSLVLYLIGCYGRTWAPSSIHQLSDQGTGGRSNGSSWLLSNRTEADHVILHQNLQS